MLVISCSTVNLFICLPAGWTRTTGFCCGVHEASCWCGGLKTRRGTVCVIDFFTLWAQWCYAKQHPLQTKQKTIVPLAKNIKWNWIVCFFLLRTLNLSELIILLKILFILTTTNEKSMVAYFILLWTQFSVITQDTSSR